MDPSRISASTDASRPQHPGSTWRRRRLLAVAVRWTAIALPVAFATAGAFTVLRLLHSSGPGRPFAWIAAAITASLCAFAVDRVARHLLPLSLLLELALVFPDHAPSRLKVALRAGSPKRLLHPQDATSGQAVDAAGTVLALAASLTAHDRATRGHCERVRAYA